MRKTFALFGILLVLVGVLVVSAVHVARAAQRDARWKKVEEANNKGLPKTAIDELEPIIAGALKNKAYPEAIKAIGQKIALEGNIQGNKPEEKITRLEAEIAKAPEEMVPVMEAILADWYWHYFQQNRWRFMQRTPDRRAAGQGFHHLGPAADPAPRSTSSSARPSPTRRNSRPDPIAAVQRPAGKGHDAGQLPAHALRFPRLRGPRVLHVGRAGGGQGRGRLRAVGRQPDLRPGRRVPGMGDRRPPTPIRRRSRRSGSTRTCCRSTGTTETRRPSSTPTSGGLHFGYNKAFGEEKNARYKAALKRFVDDWGDHEISARARFALGERAAAGGRTGRGPQAGQAGRGRFPQQRRRQDVLQPRPADRGQVGHHHHRAGLERAAGRRSASRYRNVTQGLLPGGALRLR